MCRNICSVCCSLWSGQLSPMNRGDNFTEISRLCKSTFSSCQQRNKSGTFLQLCNIIKINAGYSIVQLLQLYINTNSWTIWYLKMSNKAFKISFILLGFSGQLVRSAWNSHASRNAYIYIYIYAWERSEVVFNLCLTCPFNPCKRKHYKMSCSLHRHLRPSMCTVLRQLLNHRLLLTSFRWL